MPTGGRLWYRYNPLTYPMVARLTGASEHSAARSRKLDRYSGGTAAISGSRTDFVDSQRMSRPHPNRTFVHSSGPQ